MINKDHARFIYFDFSATLDIQHFGYYVSICPIIMLRTATFVASARQLEIRLIIIPIKIG